MPVLSVLQVLFSFLSFTQHSLWHLASMQNLRQRIATLETERNAQRCTISWRFTSNDARDKLHDLYPVINNQLD